MPDAVLSQIEQILQGIETRTPHSPDCNLGKKTTYGGGDEEWPEWTAPMTFTGCTCSCDKLIRVRTEIAQVIERMVIAAAQTYHGATFANQMAWQDDENAPQDDAMALAWAASVRAAGGTPQ